MRNNQNRKLDVDILSKSIGIHWLSHLRISVAEFLNLVGSKGFLWQTSAINLEKLINEFLSKRIYSRVLTPKRRSLSGICMKRAWRCGIDSTDVLECAWKAWRAIRHLFSILGSTWSDAYYGIAMLWGGGEEYAWNMRPQLSCSLFGALSGFLQKWP